MNNEQSIYLTDKNISRFNSKYIKTGNNDCWLWTGWKDKDSYGWIKINKKVYRAHRISYYISNGYFPINNCLHTCDTPSCVNPNHLFDGTQADNVKDCVNKGRSRYGKTFKIGDKPANRKFLQEDIEVIKYLIDNKIPQRSIAKLFKTTHTTISEINCGKTYKEFL